MSELGQLIATYAEHLTVLALLDTVLIVTVIPIVLIKKRDPTTAVAWCLVVLLVPMLGALLFWGFGVNYLQRRVTRKGQQRRSLHAVAPPARHAASRGALPAAEPPVPDLPLVEVALELNAFPVSTGNAVLLYRETSDAFTGLLEAIAAARHHVHLEVYIFRSDATGRQIIDLLVQKAKAGVQVRLLYDSAGTLWLSRSMVRPLVEAGGLVRDFLPINPLRSWIRINLRNHRKIVVVDGAVGFTGGMNVGDEHLGKSKRYGYWRDAFLRLEGPAVAGLQRIFMEDWHFAAAETLEEECYFPPPASCGNDLVQVVDSGPDQPLNSIRELYFAAILSARERLWIASPYFVPDSGILDALRLARLRGVDVRLLGLMRPDSLITFYAGRYYWADLLAMGGKVYQYARGMMHAKVMLVDDCWAMVGSANFDNRSLHLNLEAGCILYSPERIEELAAGFLRDLEDAVSIDAEAFARRSLLVQVAENACRLLSPVL
jgi:cardiolipin synthase